MGFKEINEFCDAIKEIKNPKIFAILLFVAITAFMGGFVVSKERLEPIQKSQDEALKNKQDEITKLNNDVNSLKKKLNEKDTKSDNTTAELQQRVESQAAELYRLRQERIYAAQHLDIRKKLLERCLGNYGQGETFREEVKKEINIHQGE